ncbi:MAG: hypothetical protein QNK37_18070 [Acidobacteriota bacterium]|nr:hypothetical protein [Acidobacteriota bacterium]
MDIFQADEMNLIEVRPQWDEAELLEQEGMAFLKDVAPILGITSDAVKKAHDRIEKTQGPGRGYELTGARKIWNHWIVRLSVFGPFYLKNLKNPVKRVRPEWDGNELLKQEGWFPLAEVCNKLPFSLSQIRHQAKKNPHSREQYGVWKDERMNLFLVDMEPFAEWIKSLHQAFQTPPRERARVRAAV